MTVLVKVTGCVAVLMATFLLGACTETSHLKVEKYNTLQEATTALNLENEKIDLYIAELGQAKTDTEKKHLACDKIPKQYDYVLALVDANQHLITDDDQTVQAQFKQMALEQKARFTSSLWCK